MILKSQHEFMAWRVNQMIEKELGIASGLFSSCTTQNEAKALDMKVILDAVEKLRGTEQEAQKPFVRNPDGRDLQRFNRTQRDQIYQ